MKTYAIAAIPGDGIGTEVVSAGVEVLAAIAKREGSFAFKFDHFDRLEIESHDRVVVLEGLDQAYFPILHFFWWITRAPHDRGFRGFRDESGSPPTPERLLGVSNRR